MYDCSGKQYFNKKICNYCLCLQKLKELCYKSYTKWFFRSKDFWDIENWNYLSISQNIPRRDFGGIFSGWAKAHHTKTKTSIYFFYVPIAFWILGRNKTPQFQPHFTTYLHTTNTLPFDKHEWYNLAIWVRLVSLHNLNYLKTLDGASQTFLTFM